MSHAACGTRNAMQGKGGSWKAEGGRKILNFHVRPSTFALRSARVS